MQVHTLPIRNLTRICPSPPCCSFSLSLSLPPTPFLNTAPLTCSSLAMRAKHAFVRAPGAKHPAPPTTFAIAMLSITMMLLTMLTLSSVAEAGGGQACTADNGACCMSTLRDGKVVDAELLAYYEQQDGETGLIADNLTTAIDYELFFTLTMFVFFFLLYIFNVESLILIKYVVVMCVCARACVLVINFFLSHFVWTGCARITSKTIVNKYRVNFYYCGLYVHRYVPTFDFRVDQTDGQDDSRVCVEETNQSACEVSGVTRSSTCII